MATFSSGVKCFRSFLIRSLRYLNGGALSPVPTEAGQDDHPDNISAVHRLCNFLKGSKHFEAMERKNMQLTRSQRAVLEAIHQSYLRITDLYRDCDCSRTSP